MPRVDASGTRYWVLRSEEYWRRSNHRSTALADGVVTLSRGPRKSQVVNGDPARLRYGVTWDAQGFLYRAIPAEGRIERIPPASRCPQPPLPPEAPQDLEEGACADVTEVEESSEYEIQPDGMVLTVPLPPPPELPNDCRVTYLPSYQPGCTEGALRLVEPRGLAVDGAGRLYIADAGTGRVYIIELLAGRLLGSSGPPPVAGRTPRPWDVRADPSGTGAYLLDRGTRSVWRLFPDRPPQLLLGPGGDWQNPGEECLYDPTALWVTPQGAVVVLDRTPAGPSIVWAWPRAIQRAMLGKGPNDLQIPDATTIAMDGEGDLYVAGDPDGTILRYNVASSGPEDLCLAFHLVTAYSTWQFDGGALGYHPTGAIVHTAPEGARLPTPAFPDYGDESHSGTVTTFAMDSGISGCVWHRIFFEACLPEHTALEIATCTADTISDGDPYLKQPLPPQGYEPLPPPGENDPPVLSPDAPAGWVPVPQLLGRPGGADRPFYTPQYEDGRKYDLYEALVLSPPGRRLWVRITLRGTDRLTPFLRGLRVYYPRPSYLRFLPSNFREDPRSADFLDRLLSIFEVFHSELDEVRDHLALLFNPLVTPRDALDWLAGWLGLVLDPRWPEEKRRKLIAATARLYRRRGTLAGLTEFLEIYLDQPFRILESFRLRRGGGFYLGQDRERGGSVLGVGMMLKEPGAADPFAHHFELSIVGSLTIEQHAIVKQILELERPAHTTYRLCIVRDTMSVGQRALLGISTLILRAPQVLQGTFLDQWQLGVSGLLGGPAEEEPGVSVGKSLIGRNTTLR